MGWISLSGKPKEEALANFQSHPSRVTPVKCAVEVSLKLFVVGFVMDLIFELIVFIITFIKS